MKGLTALVTGGGSGIGLATAKMLLAEGANVVITGRDSKKLTAAALDLANEDGRLKVLPGDVSSEGYANKLIGETLKAFGGLDILVNNAGVSRLGSIFDMFEEDWDYVVNINLKGTWFMSKYGARVMRDAGGGVIVNVSSFLGLRGVRGYPSSAYSAAKGGVIALTKALAVELAQFKIRVNVVVPAVINTPMIYSAVGPDRVEEFLEKSKRAHPLGRAGEPEDVARAILFLARPENGWITGTELHVDGGRSAL